MIQASNRKFEIQFGNGISNHLDMSVALKDESTTLMSSVYDASGNLYDPAEVKFYLYDSEGKLLNDSLNVTRVDTGKYRVLVTPDSVATYMGKWKTSDGDITMQMVMSVDLRLKMMMELLRSMLDKSLKDREKSWGYTDVDLLMYLISAVGEFNAMPPLTGFSVVNVPDVFRQLIINLAVLYGIQAQMMYAIDTDVSYNDQGLSLNIEHFSKLSGMYGTLASRIMDECRKAKTVMVFSMIKSVMAFNPERARTYMFTNLITPGFPYFAFGMNLYNIFI
jgi:hypothetical protein